MTTLAILTEDTRNILYGLEVVERAITDTLNGNISSGATSLTPTTTAMWKRHDLAEFPDGELYIFEADSSGATAVRSAQLGSTAAGHSDGEVMIKNPEYPRIEIVKRINQVVRSMLWPHVWSWHRDSVSASKTDFMYDLDQYIDEVVMVYQENINANERFWPLPNGWWDVERQINTAVATNGGMLRIKKVHDYDEMVYFTAKRRPHVDDLANLDDELADMIPWGAAALSLAARNPGVLVDEPRARGTSDKLQQAYRGLRAEFFTQRDEYKRLLHKEVRPEPRFRRRFSRAAW